MNGHRLLATTLVIVVVLSALAPLGTAVADEDGAALNVEVTQDDEPVVTVTENGTAVADANVTVSTVDENESDGNETNENETGDETYDGVGEYVTDENGTVELPEPESDVEIEVAAVADNRTVSTTATLEAESNETDDEVFGLLVSAFVSEHQDHEDAMGLVVANYVLDQNPGNSPIQAGPPGDVGPAIDAGAGNAGPPAHAGGPDDGDETDDNETEGDDDDDRGPPAHAGGPGDDGDDDDSDGEDGSDDEKRAGPPDHAGGPDDGDETDDSDEDDDSDGDDEDDETDADE